MPDLSGTGQLLPPTQITDAHDLSRFESGVETIDTFLKTNALSNHRAKYSLVLVVADEAHVVFAYYALAIGKVTRKVGTKGRARSGAPAQIPAVILGRLGVDKSLQGEGVGKDLLVHAIGATLAIAEGSYEGPSPPISVMAIKALNADVAAFYQRFGFEAFDPEHPLELVRSLRDLRLDHEAAMIEARKTWKSPKHQQAESPR